MSSHNTEILIVDESSSIRADIAEYLGDEYIIYYAADGDEGWKLLQTNDSISLVFTDMYTTLADDMLLLQKIREAGCEHISNIPVIIITSAAETEELKNTALNLGATDFIHRPFDKIAVLSRTRSYTKYNQQIANLEKKAAYDTLTGLYSNRMLLDFGHKTISFANRHNVDASVLYVEIADTQKLIETHGSKSMGTIVSTVGGLIENSIRKEELLAHIDDGRFAIILPNTKTFMAHIVASRLKEAVEELVFTFNNIKVQISLAIGMCSTEACEKSRKVAFEEYCVHAAHALAASLETPNKRIIKYDETAENKLGDAQSSNALAAQSDLQESKDAYAEYLAGIMEADYNRIPLELVPTFIEPLESFLEYAQAVALESKKASG